MRDTTSVESEHVDEYNQVVSIIKSDFLLERSSRQNPAFIKPVDLNNLLNSLNESEKNTLSDIISGMKTFQISSTLIGYAQCVAVLMAHGFDIKVNPRPIDEVELKDIDEMFQAIDAHDTVKKNNLALKLLSGIKIIGLAITGQENQYKLQTILSNVQHLEDAQIDWNSIANNEWRERLILGLYGKKFNSAQTLGEHLAGEL